MPTSMQDLAAIRNRIDQKSKRANRQALARYGRTAAQRCRIGIDPAFRENGFCMCIIDEEGTARFTYFTDYNQFLKWLWSDAPEIATVTVENSNKQNKTFDMSGNKATVARKSRNVGTNQAVSELAVRACVEHYGADNVNNISPKQKGAKWNDTTFKSVATMRRHKIIRYTGKADERDAYQLAVWGL